MNKIKYDKTVFVNNFKNIMLSYFDINSETASYRIHPNYDASKGETGEDSVFRMVILSDENIGNKKISFEDAVEILTAFEPHYPTKITITKASEDEEPVFNISCSTRVRKPSAIADMGNGYSPFTAK